MPAKTVLVRVKTSERPIGKKRTASGLVKPGSRGRSIVSVPRSQISPLTYKFRQTFVDNVELNTSTAPAGWSANGNALVKQMIFTLGDIPNFSRFTNMFAQYRLTAVKTEMLFSNNVSDLQDPSGSSTVVGNRQIVVYTMPNRVGAPETLTEDAFLQTQAHQHKLALNTTGEPLTYIQHLSQLANTYQSGINTDYAKRKPLFISTQEQNTGHYGLDMRIQRVDGEAFSRGTATYPTVKILHTVYFECRQVN